MSNRQVSQGTRFLVQSEDLGVGTVITAATNAAPANLQYASLPAEFVPGVLVFVQDTGWKSLDDRPFQISSISADATVLGDSDTTDEEDAMAAAGNVVEVPLTEACMATLTITSPEGTQIDLTTMCEDARVTKPGLPALSTWQATGFWDITEATQRRLRTLYRSREQVVFETLFPDGSGLAFVASVGSFDVRGGVDTAIGITVGGTCSGVVTYIDPVVES
jgi:hypothetical protein